MKSSRSSRSSRCEVGILREGKTPNDREEPPTTPTTRGDKPTDSNMMPMVPLHGRESGGVGGREVACG